MGQKPLMNTLRTLPIIRIAACCLALAGCASGPPAQYVTLNPVAPAGAPAALSGGPLQLGQVNLPDALDRPYLVSATGPNTRNVSSTIRWITPLDKLVRDTLAHDLAKRLNATALVKTAAHGDQPTRVLNISILSFMPDSSNQVQLQARWQVKADYGGTSASGRTQLTVAANSGSAGDIAAAMSQALAQLTTQIVTRLGVAPD